MSDFDEAVPTEPLVSSPAPATEPTASSAASTGKVLYSDRRSIELFFKELKPFWVTLSIGLLITVVFVFFSAAPAPNGAPKPHFGAGGVILLSVIIGLIWVVLLGYFFTRARYLWLHGVRLEITATQLIDEKVSHPVLAPKAYRRSIATASIMGYDRETTFAEGLFLRSVGSIYLKTRSIEGNSAMNTMNLHYVRNMKQVCALLDDIVERNTRGRR